MIRQLKSQDLVNFLDFCSKKDRYNDFYITEDNNRKYLTDLNVSKRVFNRCLKAGDKCYVKISSGEIRGILLITGFSDNFNRKYVSVFAESRKDTEDLFQFLNWQKLPELYIKAKKNNKYLIQHNKETDRYYPSYPLRKARFYVRASRGKELLLTNKEKKYEPNKHSSKSN